MTSPKELSQFGIELSAAMATRQKDFDSSLGSWPKEYALNSKNIEALKVFVQKKSSALVVGAGLHASSIDYKAIKKQCAISGVSWLNFQDQIEIDVLLSTHVAPLQASFFGSQNNSPKLIIHAVYEKVPPVLKKSITIRWGDPLMDKSFVEAKPTAKQFDDIFKRTSRGSSPLIPAVRNVTFVNAMTMIWLGAKEIIFTGVDPLNPQYFFNGHPKKALQILEAISKIDPYVAIWDGRNTRIGKLNRDTDHRMLEIFRDVSNQKSAIDKRIDVMQQGFKVLQALAAYRAVKLSYIGESEFLKRMGMKRID